MSDILFTALSGLMASQRRASVSANNLANLHTPAYQARKATSASLSGSNGGIISDTVSISNTGFFVPTGNPFDLGINGNGYFQVTDDRGNEFYTRDGSFTLGENNRIVTRQGYSLSPPITVPEQAQGLSIGTDGTITVQIGSQNQELGTIQIAQFSNQQGLANRGGNLQSATGTSGMAIMGNPGIGGRGTILSGYMESSNVDIAQESISLLTEETMFHANAAVIRTADAMSRETIDLIG